MSLFLLVSNARLLTTKNVTVIEGQVEHLHHSHICMKFLGVENSGKLSCGLRKAVFLKQAIGGRCWYNMFRVTGRVTCIGNPAIAADYHSNN